ncbi:hypothetical protein [Streptomyces sp. NPDC051079]|uniref:hypothetical protein n=1 Tax=Streptomyces sp. NPDC051079 TaxID=3155043 RepID=UPI00344CC5A4
MAEGIETEARRRLAGLADAPLADGAPAQVLQEDAALVGRLLAAVAQRHDTGEADTTAGDVAAALGLFGDMRMALDQMEAQAVIEARRSGMEWREIAHHQGMKSSQAASQRYQRLLTRLEEIRQGIR